MRSCWRRAGGGRKGGWREERELQGTDEEEYIKKQMQVLEWRQRREEDERCWRAEYTSIFMKYYLSLIWFAQV
eukprot:745814-Hanusia_phi.AAC.2